MPTKKGTCCKEKGVLVSMYVEKLKRRAFSNHRHHHHHHHHNNHHHIHPTIKREVVHYRRGADGRGYISRRAELLQYSQHLRQSARSAPAASTALNPRPYNTNSQQSHAQGTCCKEKEVLVSVYVEKPKRRRGADGRGYISRRAELPQYSQHLRQSARSAPAASTALNPRPNNITNSQQSHAQIVAVRRKPNKISKAPIGFGNWKIPDMFGFFTSSQAKKGRKTRKKHTGSTTSNKIKAVIRSLKVQKQVFSNVFKGMRRSGSELASERGGSKLPQVFTCLAVCKLSVRIDGKA